MGEGSPPREGVGGYRYFDQRKRNQEDMCVVVTAAATREASWDNREGVGGHKQVALNVEPVYRNQENTTARVRVREREGREASS